MRQDAGGTGGDRLHEGASKRHSGKINMAESLEKEFENYNVISRSSE